MSDREELEGLLARVRKATGPDRELGARIQAATTYIVDGAPVTASIDAALALVERCLPGKRLHAYHEGSGDAAWSWFVDIMSPQLFRGDPVYRGCAATFPLAILAALLQALLAEKAKAPEPSA